MEFLRSSPTLRAAGAEGAPAFLQNYDMGRPHLVQGCDVWLNTPRRPREASGTSGMKAAFNGVLNLSILDGWWDEATRTRASSWEKRRRALRRGDRKALSTFRSASAMFFDRDLRCAAALGDG
jgi:hypothetical protein